MTFKIGFATSTGPVPFVYISETCTEKGTSLAVFNIWLGAIIVSFITPFLISGLGVQGTFIFYMSIAFAGVFAIGFLVKETRGLTDKQCRELYLKNTLEISSKVQPVENGPKQLGEDAKKKVSDFSSQKTGSQDSIV